MQDSLPAGGLRLYREGGFEPSGSFRKDFRLHPILAFQDFLLSQGWSMQSGPFAGAEQVAWTLCRPLLLTPRVAISNNRILDIEEMARFASSGRIIVAAASRSR